MPVLGMTADNSPLARYVYASLATLQERWAGLLIAFLRFYLHVVSSAHAYMHVRTRAGKGRVYELVPVPVPGCGCSQSTRCGVVKTRKRSEGRSEKGVGQAKAAPDYRLWD